VKLLQVSFESDFSILHKLKNFLSDAKQIAKYINHFFKEKLRTLYLLSAKKKRTKKCDITIYRVKNFIDDSSAISDEVIFGWVIFSSFANISLLFTRGN